jgi:hypothetical protein
VKALIASARLSIVGISKPFVGSSSNNILGPSNYCISRVLTGCEVLFFLELKTCERALKCQKRLNGIYEGEKKRGYFLLRLFQEHIPMASKAKTMRDFCPSESVPIKAV